MGIDIEVAVRADLGRHPAVGSRNLLPDHHRLGFYEFFVTYMSTGVVFAVVAFIVSAVSAPMIFDRAADTGLRSRPASRPSASIVGDDRVGCTDRRAYRDWLRYLLFGW